VRTRIRRAKQLLEAQLAALSGDAHDLLSTESDLDDWARAIRERLLG
jgi:RNA polymerase sigma-70 factor (ECF subfamily)